MNKREKRAFTILELLISMFLVTLLMGPILNTFQVSERMSRRNYKSFTAHNLASEMMSEIAKKSFDDPYQASTINVNLKPGPTHEEYLPDDIAPKIANGTVEIGGIAQPRLLNETLINRSKYYNDIDDYDGYNTDESILPTLANGKEYIVDGENPYANLRVKVEVKSDTGAAQPPEEVLKNGATLGNDPKGLAITPDGKYAAVINAGDKTLSIINLQTGYEVDCGPNNAGLDYLCDTPCTAGVDRIPLSSVKELPGGTPSYNLGAPEKIILGPAGDRFYVLHKADILDPDHYSGVTTIDMNPYNQPEASFHKVFDTNLVSKDLRSNSINSITVDKDGIVYAATNGGGLSKSVDNGESWALQKLLLADGSTVCDTVYCLAAVKRGYGTGDNKYVYAGGKGGLWISKNNGAWSKVGAAGSSNITAIAAMDNGYVIAGADNGNIYVSREYDVNFIQKNGPSAQKLNTLAIDDNYRAWAGNDTGQFYSENVFHSAIASWTAHMPQGVTTAKVNSIYIDRSQTYPAPFTKILDRDANPVPSNPACPSLLANESGLHLFYLDDSGEVGAGNASAFNNPKLWYVNSSDFGKTWGTPKKICDTPAGKAAWAHSEIIDKNGVLHAVWRDNRSGNWQVYYTRSDDGGKTWPASDFCIGNESCACQLNSLSYQNGNLIDWLSMGSNYLRQIAVSGDNRVFVIFTGGGNHYVRYSNDGGRSWPVGNIVSIPFTSGVTSELIQSIDYIKPMDRLMLVLITGSDSLKRKIIYLKIDADGTVQTLTSSLNITDANRSIAPVFNEEWKFFYFYQYSEGAYYNISQSYSHYPYDFFPQPMIRGAQPNDSSPEILPVYTNFSRNKIQRKQFRDTPVNVREIYPPACLENNVYMFFGSSAIGAAAAPRYLLLKKSCSSGASYCDPIYIDKIHNNFDSATATVYGDSVYIVKKSANASPGSNLQLGEFSRNLGFSCVDNHIFTFNAAVVPLKAISNHDFNGERIKCFTGDDCGNMLYATSNGLFVRSINFANNIVQTPPDCASLINYPVEFEGLKWRRFFNGISINCVFAEKGGVWWAGAGDMGIFRTSDYGQTWSRIEAKLSNFTGELNFAGKGSALHINNIAFESTRFNLKNPEDSGSLITEKLFSVYDLGCNKIESATLAARGQDGNLTSARQIVSVNSFDNSKIIIYNGLDKKIIIKKNDREYIHALSAGSSQNSPGSFGESDHLSTGIFLDGACTIEITASRKFSVYRNLRQFFTTPGDSENSYGILNFKIGSAAGKCFQYFQGAAPAAGELIYFLAPVELFSAWKNLTGYCLIKTVVKHFPEQISVSSSINTSIDKAFAAPDNKTVFFTSYSGNKVYSISDINDTASIQIKQYSQNVIKPSAVIFSPKNRSGDYKTYIVCDNNIVDLFGVKLLPEITGLNISGAAVSDSGDMFFVDKTSKKLYKRVTSSTKTVYVTVKEADGGGTAGSMPPVTLVRKFYDWQASDEIRRGSSPNRNYIKYDYIYTSQAYPGGISVSDHVLWEPQKRGTIDTLNAYIVDKHLMVNGTLEIMAGTVVKFSTCDKLINSYNWSGKSQSGILIIPGGKLIVSGGHKETQRILFTSLDDNTIAPSAYSADDLMYSSSAGLPNLQLMRVKTSDHIEYCGVKYGDWGSEGISSTNTSGGLVFPSVGEISAINGLETKYGLFYTSALYPDGVVPPNFNKPSSIDRWTSTNVYVVSRELKAGNRTRLDIQQGAIIKYEAGASIKFENTNVDDYPWYSLIVDGSFSKAVQFSHTSNAGSDYCEGSTPSGGPGTFKTLSAAGVSDIASIKGAVFYGSEAEHLNLSGSEFKISNSTIGRKNFNEKFSVVMSNYDSSAFYDNVFNLYHNCVNLSNDAANLFLNNSFEYNLSADYATLTANDYLLSVDSGAVLIFKNNDLVVKGTAGDKLSKIMLKAAGYITANRFRTLLSNTTCEINISQTSAPPPTPAWPLIRNNLFHTGKCAIYVNCALDDAAASTLDDKIINNSFIDFETIIKNEASDKGDFPQSPAGAAQDADGNIYISDSHTKFIYKYSPNGNLLMTFGGPGTGDGQFSAPAGIAVNDTGEIYVADCDGACIKKFDRDANFILKFGVNGSDIGSFLKPCAIAVCEPGTAETLFVADNDRNALLRFTNTGNFQGEFISSSMLSPASLNKPAGLTASRDSEYLYVTDTDNNRVVKIKINLTTTEIELGDDYFEIEPRVFNVNNDLATWPLGFAPGNSVDEGGHIELNVTARKSDGSTNEVYTGTKTGKIFIDNTAGIVTWEGTGITDNSADNTDNNAAYSNATFVNGAAKFYVRNTMAGANLKITIVDDANPEMHGSAEVSWLVEDTPPALEFIGANSKGFRKYTCKNDPSVTFIKIPASAFDRGDGTYGGGPTEIKMSTYYIAETLTTNAQFKRWRDSAGAPALVGAWASNSGLPTFEGHPALCVFKTDARNYSYWLINANNSSQNDKYLPTAAQYEKAMRGAKLMNIGNNALEKIWSWGSSWDPSKCNEFSVTTSDERPVWGYQGTTPVFKYPPQGYYGLFDITGNLFEWCSEPYSSTYPAGVFIDPVIPPASGHMSARGGEYCNPSNERYRCSYNGCYILGTSYDQWLGVRPCFYWPLQ